MQVVKILLLGTFHLLTYGGENQLASGQQRQHFRSHPEDQHVVEGDVAIIKCEVGNQAGRVQWAKDGFVLGFNRTIPGYPRYEMFGDGTKGEHHLKITNTSLQDDAKYQCQVGPADGHNPIRATGHLTVLLAPTSVELVGRGREKMIEVSEGEEVELECRVEDSKPVASVRWYKNNQEVLLDTREDVEEESSTQHRRHNLISRVTLRLSATDDGSHYACHAEHPALPAPLKASVKISVLYPPGPPVISGYTAGETIRAGDPRTLSCRSRGGNPLGRVVWYRNNEVIDTNDSHVGGESFNEHKFIVDSSDNGAVYTCEVRNKLTQKPLLASVKLDVHFPPDKVMISGPEQSRVGDNITLTCVVENSNPPAEVSWVVDGQGQPDAITRQEPAGQGGYHTVSRLSLTVPEVERDMMFTCHATNQALADTTVDTYLLSVLRPPKRPVLRGYSEGTGIIVGKKQSITCVSRGGNPPASLQWYRNGIKIPARPHSIDDVSSAEIEIEAREEDNEAQYRCEAHNSATSTPTSVSTTLIVYFPPTAVKITQSPPRLRAGDHAVLICETEASNPPATITWLRGNARVQGRHQDTFVTPNGGTRIKNALALNLTAADDGLTYTCEGNNPKLQRVARDAITLRVNYAPTFLSEPPSVVNVVEGQSEELNLTARGNPGPVSYAWTRQGLRLPDPVIDESWRESYALRPEVGGAVGSRVAAVGPVLYIRDVTLGDAGDYELEASNQEGATTAKVYLNVQYPPTIKYTSDVVVVSEGQDAVLECAADGNPLTEATMEWRRDDYDGSRVQKSFVAKKATLTVLRANRNDTGVFQCLVSNGIGKAATANVTLIVKTKPLVVHSPLLTRAASELSRTGRLQCLAEGAPEVRFSWKRDGILLSNGARPDKYKNETVKTSLVSWTSTFFIRNVNELDYGYYECIAENDLGASTFTVHFTRPTRPDPPMALKVINTTHDAVTLAWVPGFDGGKPQYFRLRYRPKGSTSYSYLDVYESGVYLYTVTGLGLGTEYFFSIMSYNDVDESEYRGEFVRATTRSQPLLGDRELLLNQVLGGRGDLPKLIIIVVAIVGAFIVILNIALVICLIRRKRGKRRDDEGSDQASSKSTTNTMYAPSSYNDTVVGETLSSISEKSRESYAQDDSVVDYEGGSHYCPSGHVSPSHVVATHLPGRLVPAQLFLYDQYHLLYGCEQTHKHAASTYLIDQIEPPPEYASQTPSQPSSAAYDPHEDDYAEVLRRNAYNHQLGKGTPRPPSRATHYSTSPEARGYLSYSYTPSPTGVPNGAAQYHAGGPSVTLGLHDHVYPGDLSMEGDHVHALQSLGLDSDPPPSLGLEQHSIPSEHPSLTLDPHSITIDHPVIAVTDFSKRNGDLRVQPTSLSTFNPNPSPSTFSESDLEGHLV